MFSTGDCRVSINFTAAEDGPGCRGHQTYREANLRSIGRKLIADIQRSKSLVPAQSKTEAAINYLGQAHANVYGKMPRIALWPFRQDLVPLSKSVDDRMND